MAIRCYKIECILPRTKTRLEIYSTKTLDEAEEYCNKNKKYFPELIITAGNKLTEYYEASIVNEAHVDYKRDAIVDVRIGKLKKKSKFTHSIVFENEKKVCFLIRYKKSQARVCIIDADDKEKVMDLIKHTGDCYRIKIHRGALPLVYFRYNSRNHKTLLELVFGRKPSGFMNFKDGNPYNYCKANVFFTNVSRIRNRQVPKSGYYGVIEVKDPERKTPYQVSILLNGKLKRVGRYYDPLLAAKSYDSAMMEHFGRKAAKNFTYEYYAAFEPEYIANVS